jgi:opine dehydrogenase
MGGQRVVVLGAGNTGVAMAADLALAGHGVLLWEHPAFAAALEPIRGSLAIRLEGAARTGPARLTAATTDAAEALAWSDTLLCSVPSYAHAPVLAEIRPFLRPGHLLALLPGNLGALAVGRALAAAGVSEVVAESDTAPYVCRKTGPDAASSGGG